jgi:hypothetical protein
MTVDRSSEPIPQGYEPPSLKALGTVHDLTLTDKKYGASDGFTFMGDPITNAST